MRPFHVVHTALPLIKDKVCPNVVALLSCTGSILAQFPS